MSTWIGWGLEKRECRFRVAGAAGMIRSDWPEEQERLHRFALEKKKVLHI